MNNIQQITIIPAYFIEKIDDKRCMVRCQVGRNEKTDDPIIEDRRFEIEMVEGIEDPTYLFIGIMHGQGFVQLNFKDAKDYEDMFKEKWGELLI